MILYRVFGITDNPRAMIASCSNRVQAERMVSAVYGTFDNAVWSMRFAREVANVGVFYDRRGDDPIFSLLSRMPSRVCQGEYCLRWYWIDDGDGAAWYAWAYQLGYAVHVGPRRYLLRIPAANGESLEGEGGT